MIDGKMWDEKLAEEIIFNNQKAFEYFSIAAHKPKFQDPILANPENIDLGMVLPPLNSWRIISGYSSIRALYLSKQGKDKEAMQEV